MDVSTDFKGKVDVGATFSRGKTAFSVRGINDPKLGKQIHAEVNFYIFEWNCEQCFSDYLEWHIEHQNVRVLKVVFLCLYFYKRSNVVSLIKQIFITDTILTQKCLQ